MIRSIAIAVCCVLYLSYSACVIAGGAFFSTAESVDQSSEQIIFNQEGDLTTMMVRIRYTGEAQDFAWVIPVPSTPTISTGSDLLFTDLELATRPVFNLQRDGAGCDADFQTTSAPLAMQMSDPVSPNIADLDVLVDQSLDVGPFEAQVVSSDSSDDLKQWLVGNGYHLSGRGAHLIEEYVQAGMKFVALKLRSDENEGSIVPVILRYNSDSPVIPIRLTSVSAVENLGVLVWLLGEARAVPQNYLHVVPNYTRLNWFGDSRNVFGSYQQLISEAMDEAGGQGFSTDFSGVLDNLDEQLVSPAKFEDRLAQLQGLTDIEYLSSVQENFFDSRVRQALSTLLPLPEGQSESLYYSADALALTFAPEQLSAARVSLDHLIEVEIIDPVRRSRAVIDENKVITRLYTTLSAEEMTSDPRFVFNPDMPPQPADRQALIATQCVGEQTEWRLSLGSGTGRDGELVMVGRGEVPALAPSIEQTASWKVETTFSHGDPVVATEREFEVVPVNVDNADTTDLESIALDQPAVTQPETITDSADIVVTASQPVADQQPSRAGGGAGSVGIEWWSLLLVAGFARCRRKSRD